MAVASLSCPELLAPAGDWDCLRAAIENGADAVYFGLDRFNARMRAHNFTEADLPKVVATLHQRGLKAYVTISNQVVAHAASLGTFAAIGRSPTQGFGGEASAAVSHAQCAVDKDLQRQRFVQNRRLLANFLDFGKRIFPR